VADLGEFGLIRRATAGRRQPASTLLGPGDDAAVVAAPDGRVVATVDLLVQGVHFRLDWSTPEQVGRKAAAASLADLAAMGAEPSALLVGLACPPDTPIAVTDGLAAGLWSEAQRVGVGLVGGDVVAADVVTLAVTALGSLAGRDPVTRSGARPGDVVAVCGRLGWAAAGLAVLSRGTGIPAEPGVGAAHQVPEPPYPAGPAAAAAGATAMIDVSDGLLADLGHVAAASGVRIELRRATLAPPTELVGIGEALGVDPWRWVLTGGEDHALVATFPSTAVVPAGWRVIGAVAPGDGVRLDGERYRYTAGWDHFRGR
jgi:thiamine-monophosphate kinase